MGTRIILSAILALLLAPTALAQEPGHLRLIDRLDRPADGLCLAAGDRWRTLTVEACDEVPAARARWELDRGPF